MRGGRCEDVASVERCGDRGERDLIGLDGERARRFPKGIPRQRQHAVVRPYQERASRFHRDGEPRRSHAGVNDCQVHRGRRGVGNGVGEDESTAPNVSGGDAVRQVDHSNLGCDSSDDRVTHTHILVVEPVVRKEQDAPGQG